MALTDSQELYNLVRDAYRYRELRKHVNRGYPQPGIPFAMGWVTDDGEKLTGDAYYIREGELDSAMDEVLDAQGVDPGDIYDRLLEGSQ